MDTVIPVRNIDSVHKCVICIRLNALSINHYSQYQYSNSFVQA